MGLSEFIDTTLPKIEAEMQECIDIIYQPGHEDLNYMLTYHMGWKGEGAGEKARGKRLRPILLLLTTEAAGENWETALPAAAAVELVHNFSLIHDDIEDDSALRRGRETVWKKWGLAQGINAGDSMFALAHIALERLHNLVPNEISLEAHNLLSKSCLILTQGQFLDLSYENRLDLKTKEYWPMIQGKTASLIATCTELGALIAGSDTSIREFYRKFGEHLGLAFQVQDDILGIWGDAALTGKSAESDLLTGKKSLPVLYGLEKQGEFYKRWQQGPINPVDVPKLTQLLEAEGAYGYAKSEVGRLSHQALEFLQKAKPQPPASEYLLTLTNKLIHRNT